VANDFHPDAGALDFHLLGAGKASCLRVPVVGLAAKDALPVGEQFLAPALSAFDTFDKALGAAHLAFFPLAATRHAPAFGAVFRPTWHNSSSKEGFDSEGYFVESLPCFQAQ
jgi:hypothetical protein